MTEGIQVLTTLGNREDARRLAARLVDERLAGCVQISGPLESVYRWQGKVETDEEWLCAIKTTRDRYPELERVLQELHPYDEPEILAVPVEMGSRGYLHWLSEQVRRAD